MQSLTWMLFWLNSPVSSGHWADMGSGFGSAIPSCLSLFWLHTGGWCGVLPPLPRRAHEHIWLPVPGEHTDPVGHALPAGPGEQLCGALPKAFPFRRAVWPPQSEHKAVQSLEEGQVDQWQLTAQDFCYSSLCQSIWWYCVQVTQLFNILTGFKKLQDSEIGLQTRLFWAFLTPTVAENITVCRWWCRRSQFPL